MKMIMTAMLTIVPVLLAQDTVSSPPQTKVMINQMGPLMSSGMEVVTGALVGGTPVSGAPYSGQEVTESTQTLADGSHIVHNSSSMVYRDSQGRERHEMGPMVMISDPVTGSNYTLDASSRTAHKMPAPQVMRKMADGNVMFQRGIELRGSLITTPAMAATAGPQSTMVYKSVTAADGGKLPAPAVEQLGTNNIEGVQAEGTRTTQTIPLGQAGNDRDLNIVSERWYSQDLKMTILSKHNDPRTGLTEYRLTQINRSEPAASLFQVPADYTVVDAPAAFTEKIKTKHE